MSEFRFNPKAEDLIHLLCDENPAKCLSKFKSDDYIMFRCFQYYSDESQIDFIADEILKNEKKVKCVEGLVKLYPFSEPILSKINSKLPVSDMQKDSSNWYDVSETISKMVAKFTTMLNRDNPAEVLKSLSSQIAELDKKRNEFASELSSVKAKNKELDELKAEKERLESEINQEKGITKDSLEKELADSKASLDDVKQQNDQRREELKKIKEKIEQCTENHKSERDFEKVYNMLKDVFKKFPTDEVDA